MAQHHAACRRVPVDSRNQRRPDVPHARKAGVADLAQYVDTLILADLRHLLQIHTGAERPAVATGQDRSTNLRVSIDLLPDTPEPFERLHQQRVTLPWPVERDGRHMLINGVKNNIVVTHLDRPLT
jgi:hypothetical protein